MSAIRYVILMLLGTACATANDNADVTLAEQSFTDARSAGALATLPTTMDRAHAALLRARELHYMAAKADGDGLRERYESAAAVKAQEAERLTAQARALSLRIKAWDERIERYAEEQVTYDLSELVIGRLASTCDHEGPESRLGIGASGARGESAELVHSSVAFFKQGDAAVRDRDLPAITALAELLQASPNLQVTLIGYADGRGSANTNERLALTRASEVAHELINQGISASRVDVAAAGAEDADTTGDAAAAALDRRVEAIVVGLPDDAD